MRNFLLAECPSGHLRDLYLMQTDFPSEVMEVASHHSTLRGVILDIYELTPSSVQKPEYGPSKTISLSKIAFTEPEDRIAQFGNLLSDAINRLPLEQQKEVTVKQIDLLTHKLNSMALL